MPMTIDIPAQSRLFAIAGGVVVLRSPLEEAVLARITVHRIASSVGLLIGRSALQLLDYRSMCARTMLAFGVRHGALLLAAFGRISRHASSVVVEKTTSRNAPALVARD
jgi:hypothetical protein